MQQHNSNVLIQKEEQIFNKLKREEVVPRYRSTSSFYYRKVRRMKSLNKKLKILNLQFIMLLSKKPELRAS